MAYLPPITLLSPCLCSYSESHLILMPERIDFAVSHHIHHLYRTASAWIQQSLLPASKTYIHQVRIAWAKIEGASVYPWPLFSEKCPEELETRVKEPSEKVPQDRWRSPSSGLSSSSFSTGHKVTMGSTDLAVREYWGYLVKPDKSPTPVFEQLLLGIANYIVSSLWLLRSAAEWNWSGSLW